MKASPIKLASFLSFYKQRGGRGRGAEGERVRERGTILQGETGGLHMGDTFLLYRLPITSAVQIIPSEEV